MNTEKENQELTPEEIYVRDNYKKYNWNGTANTEDLKNIFSMLKEFGQQKYHQDLKDAEQSKWIPVEERLPEKNGYYICWCKNPSESGLIHFYFNNRSWGNGFYDNKVTHWKELSAPDLPEQGKEKEL